MVSLRAHSYFHHTQNRRIVNTGHFGGREKPKADGTASGIIDLRREVSAALSQARKEAALIYIVTAVDTHTRECYTANTKEDQKTAMLVVQINTAY